MEYILTKEEMDNLTNKTVSDNTIESMEKALEWCRKQLQLKDCGNAYCDFCPVSWLGSDYIDGEYVDKVKGMGKTPTIEVSNQVCKLKRNYSK